VFCFSLVLPAVPGIQTVQSHTLESYIKVALHTVHLHFYCYDLVITSYLTIAVCSLFVVELVKLQWLQQMGKNMSMNLLQILLSCHRRDLQNQVLYTSTVFIYNTTHLVAFIVGWVMGVSGL